jgi:transcriptional regulator with GAF, ATPase, and Fis domain
VLIEGESGTGKELVARAVHDYSPRREQPFVAINCAAVPSQLLESELFGHARGAFTDARVARAGLFVEAQGGTLFLDEIGEMPLGDAGEAPARAAGALLRPVGSDREQPFDVRIIAATNRDLEEEVKAHHFREDLYYRVAVVGIHVPDAARAARTSRCSRSISCGASPSASAKQGRGHLARQALQRLLAYPWPGNVRELENSMERAVALTRFDHITPKTSRSGCARQ